MKMIRRVIAGLLAAVGALLLAMSGYFSVLLGSYCSVLLNSSTLTYVGTNDSMLLFSMAGFLVSTGLGFLVLKSVFKVAGKGLCPLTIFLATCFLSGLLYDHLGIPEGFKLLGFLLVMLAAGMYSVRMIIPTKS